MPQFIPPRGGRQSRPRSLRVCVLVCALCEVFPLYPRGRMEGSSCVYNVIHTDKAVCASYERSEAAAAKVTTHAIISDNISQVLTRGLSRVSNVVEEEASYDIHTHDDAKSENSEPEKSIFKSGAGLNSPRSVREGAGFTNS